MWPSPPHFTPLMNLVWVDIVIRHRRVCASQTCIQMHSLDARYFTLAGDTGGIRHKLQHHKSSALPLPDKFRIGSESRRPVSCGYVH